MNPIALVLLSVTGLLGVWLFVLQSDQHAASMAEAKARHQLESERFDRDFETAFNTGRLPADASREARIQQLESDLARAKAEREANEAATKKAQAELTQSIGEMAGQAQSKGDLK